MAVHFALNRVEVGKLAARGNLPCDLVAVVPEEIVIGHLRAIRVIAAEEVLQDLLVME